MQLYSPNYLNLNPSIVICIWQYNSSSFYIYHNDFITMTVQGLKSWHILLELDPKGRCCLACGSQKWCIWIQEVLHRIRKVLRRIRKVMHIVGLASSQRRPVGTGSEKLSALLVTQSHVYTIIDQTKIKYEDSARIFFGGNYHPRDKYNSKLIILSSYWC